MTKIYINEKKSNKRVREVLQMANISLKNRSTTEKVIAFSVALFIAILGYWLFTWWLTVLWGDISVVTKIIVFVLFLLITFGAAINELNKPNSKFGSMIKKKQ